MSRYHKGERPIFTRQGVFVLAVIVVIVLCALILKAVNLENDSNDVTVLPPDSAYNLEMVVIPSDVENEAVHYTGFTIGFNRDKHLPNYAVWTLTPERTDGPFSRKGVKFVADRNVNGSAKPDDYRKSGFDRGHMVPAADMKWSADAMADCHYMTNICPQDNSLNSGAWANVENLARKWANKFGRLVIVAGPVLSDYLTRSIGESEVAVPERFFKVMIAPDAQPPMGIGFIMPNGYVEGGAQQAAVSIDQVEAITGFDFFSELPDDIEQDVESQKSFHQWNIR